MADKLNFQVASEGFGSYLSGILPDDIAISSGAFSASMQQIRNILSIDFEKFAQVVYSTEVVNTGLNLVNGSDVPTNVTEAQLGYNITALGSGPYGTYTASDFFGCMSGLPYSWQDILNGISQLQTQKLKDIYRELFLAVEWEGATATVTYTTGADPDGFGNYDWYWQITAITLTDRGGGYGRGNAPVPTINITGGSGASVTVTIGTNDTLAGSNGTGLFGRIDSFIVTSLGTKVYYSTGEASSTPGPVPSPPVAQIQCPPSAYLPYPYTTASNTAYSTTWTSGGLNSTINSIISDANVEIANIRTLNPYLSNNLNTVYNSAGTQLKIEQRARFSGIGPVAVPRDDFTNIYPTSLSVFVDSLPSLAQDTRPHMYAQTLEAISNINTVGGQSIVAMMRQERNAARLQELGIELDNNISGEYSPEIEKLLLGNGTAPVGIEGIDVDGINGNIESPITTFTLPSNLIQQDNNGTKTIPKPIGYYDPNTLQIKQTPATSTLGQFSPLQSLLNLQNNTPNNTNLLGPSGDGTGPANPIVQPQNATQSNGISVSPNNVNPKPNQIPLNFQTGLVNTSLPTQIPVTPNQLPAQLQPGVQLQPVTQTEPIVIVSVGPQVPLGLGVPIDTGKPATLGSLAGSKAQNLIPPNLNGAFIASTLTPSTLSVQEAIDNVILCNCDCWVD